ncbi:MAG: 4'-phosphopantetheinyl transferase superfamily protein [SAR324 cluster bacterium]|nr:4'-phosphopantetheinyl transferase superfamily protein [SAR324 cluster bacterium]
MTAKHRRAEFLLGRACAHQALSAFRLSHLPILRNQNRAPIWPESIVGSISHTENWAVAAVGKQTDVKAIGIDIENLKRIVNFGIQRHVCVAEENEWLSQFGSDQFDTFLKIVFSAKESIFKCLNPLTGVYLDFLDARVALKEDSKEFEFTLLKDCGSDFPVGFQYKGSYQIVKNLVLTSIWVSA